MASRAFVAGLVMPLVIGFAIAPRLHAQEWQWQDLARIKVGTKIQVVERSLKSTTGRFLRISDQDLTVEVQKREVVLPREQVYRVSISGKNRKRNVLIGLGAGAAVGGAIGAVVLERESGYGGAVAGVVAGWAGIGAGIGAVCPAAKTVYRADTPKDASPKQQSEPKR